MKLPKSNTMLSTHQSHIPPKNLSIQAKYVEILSNLHSSIIYIIQLCDNECIVTFDNHKFIVHRKIEKPVKAIRTQHMDYVSSLWGRTAWSPGLVMIPATHHTITEKECQCLARIPQADTVTANAKTDEVPRHIKQHEAKLEKRYQMVNSEDIMKKQLLESLDKK